VLLDFDGVKNPSFDDVKLEVASSSSGQVLHLLAELPGEKPIEYAIEPRKTRDDPQPMLSITSARCLKLESRRRFDRDAKAPVFPTSPASHAEPAFDFDDEIIGTTDPADPSKMLELPPDPRKPSQRDFFEFERRMLQLAGKDITIQVERPNKDPKVAPEIVTIKVPPSYRWSIGARMGMGKITAIRKGSPADKAGLQVPHSPRPNFFVQGDLILSVEVKGADGKPRVFDMTKHDPERLPIDLREWSKELDAATPGAKIDRTVKLKLRRHREEGGDQFVEVPAELTWDPSFAYDQNAALSAASPLAIPELGLAYQVQTTVAEVTDPASKLQAGDVIKNLKVKFVNSKGKEETNGWTSKRDFGPEEWATIGNALTVFTDEIKAVILRVQRGKETLEIEVVPSLDKSWPTKSRGWILSQDVRRQRADTMLDAVSMGLRDTRRFMVMILQNLRQMVTGRVDFRGVGGPIMIAEAAYGFAGYGMWEFVFFLAMISINLAVVNFLPIPILDGGHMVFLLYEGIRGKPPSEGVRIGASYLGLAFLLGLMLMVCYLDITRIFF
jgi:regulator of sigma E protease